MIGTFYEDTPAKLLDAGGYQIGSCLDSPNAIAFCMAKDNRIMKVKTGLGSFPRKDYENRFWFVVKEFDEKTAYWTRF